MEEIKIPNPNQDVQDRVLEAMEMFRPQLQADGGDMEFVEIDDQMRLHLKLTGACGACPMAIMTLKMGIERYIQDAVPEITEVIQDLPEGSKLEDSIASLLEKYPDTRYIQCMAQNAQGDTAYLTKYHSLY